VHFDNPQINSRQRSFQKSGSEERVEIEVPFEAAFTTSWPRDLATNRRNIVSRRDAALGWSRESE
jgi:hypothetical protein